MVEGRLLLSILSFPSRLRLVSSTYLSAALLYTRRLSPGTSVLVFLTTAIYFLVVWGQESVLSQ